MKDDSEMVRGVKGLISVHATEWRGFIDIDNDDAQEIINLVRESDNQNKADLVCRAKEYAEFFEATKNFNTLGFFNDLINFLEPPEAKDHD